MDPLDLYDSGYAEGFDKGYRIGFEEGNETAAEELDGRLRKMWAEIVTLNARIDYLTTVLEEKEK